MVDGHHIRLALTYITDRLTCEAVSNFAIQRSIQLYNNMAEIRYNKQ